MANTTFNEIYELNDIIKTDSRLMNKPINLIYQLYFKYLQYAISFFENDCCKDISNFTGFSQIEYEFITNGTSNEFILDTAPPTDCLFYVLVDNIPTNYFIYDSNTLTITLTNTPSINSIVEIAAYVIGSFNVSLNLTEKMILVQGMLVPWLEENRNRNNLLQQAVFSSDFKMSSQAEHIHQLNISIDNQYWKNVKSKINEYSFKYNSNLNGLGGGLT